MLKSWKGLLKERKGTYPPPPAEREVNDDLSVFFEVFNSGLAYVINMLSKGEMKYADIFAWLYVKNGLVPKYDFEEFSNFERM